MERMFDLPLNENAPSGRKRVQSQVMCDLCDSAEWPRCISCLFSTQSHPTKRYRARARGGFELWYLNGTSLVWPARWMLVMEWRRRMVITRLKRGRLSYDNLDSEIKKYMRPSVSYPILLPRTIMLDWSYGMKTLLPFGMRCGLNQESTWRPSM